MSEWPLDCLKQFERKRSDLPMPYIRSDGMDTILNHADGKLYDSKSAYYGAVKAAGCEIADSKPVVTAKPKPPGGIGQDIKTAIEQLKGRV